MKTKLNYLLGGLLMVAATSVFTACSDDDFTASIFDTDPSADYLDKSLFTFPLDTFVKKEFLEPYNVRFVYRMEDMGTDMEKNLTPASYDKSVDLAVLTKYLWYDVYKKVVGEQFLKQYSPRILHVIGSPQYETSSGSEELGVTEGGVKVTLARTNLLDPTDMDDLNEHFFHTMHHEFAHVLNQNIERPTAFNVISSSTYFGSDWSNQADSIAVGRGFLTPYGGEMATEDWAEIESGYITDDSLTLSRKLACASYDWEEIDADDGNTWRNATDSFNRAAPLQNPVNGSYFNSERDSIYYNLRIHGVKASDVIGYNHPLQSGSYKIYRKVISRDANGVPVPTANWKVQYLERDGIDGRAVILQKIQIVRDWLQTNFGLDLDKVRYEVQHRQYLYDDNDNLVINYPTDPLGNPILDDPHLVNKLMQPYEGDKSMTLMDYLRTWVTQYKALQTK